MEPKARNIESIQEVSWLKQLRGLDVRGCSRGSKDDLMDIWSDGDVPVLQTSEHF